MRKKLLAMLLVLIMVVSIVPLATHAEEECTEHNFISGRNILTSSPDAPSSDCHMCTICWLQEPHVDENNDGICDVCNDGACQHGIYNQLGPYEDGDYWHYYICSGCGGRGYCEHEDMSDGMCDTCGYGCQHTNTAVANYDTYCIEYCTTCGDILRETCTDEDYDGICDVCQRSISCSQSADGVHSWTYEPYYEGTTRVAGQHKKICENCGLEVLEYCENLEYARNSTEHWQVCADCGGACGLSNSAHEMVDNVCSVCGFYKADCSHWNVSFHLVSGCYYDLVCDDCGEEFGRYERHTMVDGVCTVCGYEAEHSSPDELCNDSPTGLHYMTLDSQTETTHTYYCIYCLNKITEEHTMVADINGDKYCSVCGYGCKHAGSLIYSIYSTSGNWHEVMCKTCGSTKTELHTYVDGVCTLCGFSESDECSHESAYYITYLLSHKLYCPTCYSYFNEGEHVDNDQNCICDICGGECHSLYDEEFKTIDENECCMICSNCGYVYSNLTHRDIYTYTADGRIDGSDGLCDYCDYKMSSTSTNPEPAVDTGEVTTNTSGTVSSSITVDTSALLTEDDALLIVEGYDVEIVLSVDEITSGVSSADSALILSAAGDNVTAVSYLDIDLTKMTYDTNGDIYDQEALTNLNTTVTVTVAIPQSLLDAVGTSTGTYSVVRVHDGVATVLATSYDSTAQTVTFATDRFSTYGIVFTGSTSTNNTNTGLDDVPQTGDSSLILVGIALMMAALPAVKKFVF